ncbi:RNA polymerase sigma factor [Paenibacillus sinopodophylli]|uniref:RNA polymerase sigma factor n=1 Tax=Paenibacillus sinopodophylli TaxID=1837342 RepID=UPI001FE442D6|nr:sigma factor-like helix-turn-helix DNA-binding protein [Paenibacillus sinopodophylli]
MDSYKGERVKPLPHHALIDYKRKEKRSSPQEAPYFEKLQSKVTPEMLFLVKERLYELGKFIGRLPDKQKQALLLHDWHELSYAESSDIMGIGLSHYKVVLYQARQTLRQLQREVNDDGTL